MLPAAPGGALRAGEERSGSSGPFVQGPVKQQHPDGPHAHGNTARQVADDQNAEGSGQQ